jgi:acyl-CoA hydrolase
MTHMVLPQFANNHGNAFGGQIVAWVDICAAIAAQRLCRAPVVTASIDAVHFIAPIKSGHIVVLRSQVNATFRTSMECGVSITAEDPLTGECHRAAKAYATFVALNDDGRPQPAPALDLESEEDKRRAAQAQLRREQRLALRDQMKKHA